MMSDPKRLMNFGASDLGATDEVSMMGRELLGSLEPTSAERERVLGQVIASAGLLAGASATVALSAKAGAAAAGAGAQGTAAVASAGGMSVAAKLGVFLLVAIPTAGTSAYLLVDHETNQPERPTGSASDSNLAQISPVAASDEPQGEQDERMQNLGSEPESSPLQPTESEASRTDAAKADVTKLKLSSPRSKASESPPAALQVSATSNALLEED